ncbi:MAG: hypothetical protein Q7K65_03025 [Candidatus Buchananbacteria bacterium]|nr:hypothetical protein [Candidatus Buchananbacteria bacterium]
MKYNDSYNNIKPDTIINPGDLLRTFPELINKAELLEQAEAPKMLTRLMFSLALEIEINRRNALVVINPENPEPMTLAVLAISPKQRDERTKVIRVLKQAGWAIKPASEDNFIQLSVAKFETADPKNDAGPKKRRARKGPETEKE